MKVNTHIQKLEYPEYAGFFSKAVEVDLSSHKGKRFEFNYYATQDKKLVESISKIENLPKENILITAGADAALHHIAETFLSLGKRAVIPLPAFGRFEFHTKVVGAQPVFVRQTKFPFSFDLEKITRIAYKRNANVIFLANPNNPTGELIDARRLRKFIKDNKRSVIVIDEVLVEESKDSAVSFVNEYKNLIVIKSFSKLLQIPGLRIGYVLANSELIKMVSKTVSPYEVSSMSLTVAKQMLMEYSGFNEAKIKFKDVRNFLKRKSVLPISNTNASVGLLKGKRGVCLFDYLLKHGILTVDGRNFRGLEAKNLVRIVITDKKAIRKFIKVMKKYNNAHV